MKEFYLGIDVSKGYADFVIINANKECVEPNFQLDDTFDGHNCLYEKLCLFYQNHPESRISAGLESTGGYENNWFSSLFKFQGTLNLRTARLNPLGVSANSKADLKRNITDKISAQNVSEYMIAHPEKISYQEEDHLSSLRKQWGFIKMLTKQSTQLLNQLGSLLYTANPDLLVYCKDGVPEWVLKLLKHYPTSTELSKARVASIAKIPYISSDRAKELISTAKKSVASAIDDVTSHVIASTVSQILNLKETIKAQTQFMSKHCALPEVELLKTFTGIGDYSAIGLILEIQTVERFSSAKKLSSFLGLHPAFKVSGDGASGFHMSKRGRKESRQILFMVVLSAINSNPLIKSIYQEHTQKGMNKMAAIGVCMHKTLRIIYGMLKNNKAFDPEIDRKNREKILQNPKRENKNRRFQNFDAKAPISGRQNRRREEWKKSHSDNDTKNGINSPTPEMNEKTEK